MTEQDNKQDFSEDWAPGQNVYKKQRLYVRAISGFTYSMAEQLKKLRSVPRVTKAKDLKFAKGPQYFNCTILSPIHEIAQSIFVHMVVLTPGGVSQKHGHVNEAIFYILDGEGSDVHDGKRADWKAGDIAIVPNSTVHQHFNRSKDKLARMLVLKTKPFYHFMNMLFQEVVEPQPNTPVPGCEDFKPSIT